MPTYSYHRGYGTGHHLHFSFPGLPLGIPVSSFVSMPTFTSSATPVSTSSQSALQPLFSGRISNVYSPMAPPTVATPQTTGSNSLQTSIGATSSSLPPKLIKKILDLEFVDMSELVPDIWRFQEEDDGKCCHQPRRSPKRGPVTVGGMLLHISGCPDNEVPHVCS